MAGVRYTYTTAEIALSTGVTKSILQIRSVANHRALIEGWSVSFDGTSGTADPVGVTLLNQTTDGTWGTTLTPGNKKNTGDQETPQIAGYANASAEPTDGVIIKRLNVHPQGGYEYTAPFGQELVLPGIASNRIGLKCLAAQGVNCFGTFEMNE